MCRCASWKGQDCGLGNSAILSVFVFWEGQGVCLAELGVQGMLMEGLFQPVVLELLDLLMEVVCKDRGDSSLSSLLFIWSRLASSHEAKLSLMSLGRVGKKEVLFVRLV